MFPLMNGSPHTASSHTGTDALNFLDALCKSSDLRCRLPAELRLPHIDDKNSSYRKHLSYVKQSVGVDIAVTAKWWRVCVCFRTLKELKKVFKNTRGSPFTELNSLFPTTDEYLCCCTCIAWLLVGYTAQQRVELRNFAVDEKILVNLLLRALQPWLCD